MNKETNEITELIICMINLNLAYEYMTKEGEKDIELNIYYHRKLQTLCAIKEQIKLDIVSLMCLN